MSTNQASDPVPVMLTVAGSDPSGGAGVQADLKTATTLGVYGGAVITSLTAQNTTGVSGVLPVSASFVVEQYVSVVTDLNVSAVKIGMLGTADVAQALAEALRQHPVPAVVLDPVMVATSGDRLVPDDTVDAIRQHLLPLATLITPNLPEAAALLERELSHDEKAMAAAALALQEAGANAVLVKGGHLAGDTSNDVLADSDGLTWFRSHRIETANTHGTGCTLSTAIASFLTYPLPLRDAVRHAKNYLTEALEAGSRQRLGSGRGPVDHLWQLRTTSGIPSNGRYLQQAAPHRPVF
ncbi:MAG TPA: bifunctional hydroxymethylpyrimidine kinase/phosphomethylpyrimidine kinase [Thermomicrobiales bacterium]|nr:bifunctional hydroxymethylpyrimidine kinase/phosphomethylpyrimidine kinase [Thermomicrobiales bacterium]